MKIKTSVRQIHRDTWLISEEARGASVYQYLAAGQERAALIDTGLYNTDFPSLIRELTGKPVVVVNTHGHLDHISGNHHFDTAYLHPRDEALYLQHSGLELRQAYLMAALAELGDKAPDPGSLAPILNLPQKDNRKPLFDGQRIDLGGRSLLVVETPGHTLGSVCLLDETEGLLFTGDTVCDLGVLLHLPNAAPVSVFRDSILRLMALEGRYDSIWPAHHTCPLGSEILERYLALAEKAMLGGEADSLDSAATGQGRVVSHAGLRLSLPPI